MQIYVKTKEETKTHSKLIQIPFKNASVWTWGVCAATIMWGRRRRLSGKLQWKKNFKETNLNKYICIYKPSKKNIKKIVLLP